MESKSDYTAEQALRDAADAQADILATPSSRGLSLLIIVALPLTQALMAFGPVMPSPWGSVWSLGILILTLGVGSLIVVLTLRSGVLAFVPKLPLAGWIGPLILLALGFVGYFAVRISVDLARGDQWTSVWAGLGFAAVFLVAILWLNANIQRFIAQLRSTATSR